MTTTQSPGAPVPTTNPGASTAVTDLDSMITKGEQALETAAEAAEPALTEPVLKQLFEAACNALVNWLFKPFLNTFTGQIIVGLDEYEALQSAVAAQTALNAAAQSGDLNAQAIAQATLDAAVAKAAQYVGAVVPTS